MNYQSLQATRAQQIRQMDYSLIGVYEWGGFGKKYFKTNNVPTKYIKSIKPLL